MRIRWDEDKRQLVLRRRQIDFRHFQELFFLPYVEDQRSIVPEQFRIIGLIRGQLITFVVEYRTDAIGEYIWLVTAWKATRPEEQSYYEQTTE
jgi:uncharacterized DUF497 family protein